MTGYTSYPSRYELEQVFSQFCLARFVLDFSGRKGMFITNATLEERAEFLSELFYEHTELETIREIALGTHTKTTLSGFWVESEDEKYDLLAALDKFSNEIVDEKLQMRLGSITGNGSMSYKGSVHYEQKQPGRLEFLQGTPRDFNFYLTKIHGGKYEIIIDGGRSDDSRILQKWIDRKIPKDAKIITIDQDKLSTKQTITFFDQLAKKAVTKDWKFVQVKRIVVRREDQIQEDDITEQSVLTGISQAILEGRDLRANSFVKQCEKSSYRFTAMNYEYEDKKHPYIMEVRAEFKGRPKVFEVALENYSRRVGIEENIEAENMPQRQKMDLLSRFYTQAKILYDDLTLPTLPMNPQG